MRLDDAIGMKNEVMGQILPAISQDAHFLSKRSLDFNPSAAARARGIAVGVAPSAPGQFKIALRVQHASFLDSEVIRAILKKYPNDVDLRLIGFLTKYPIRGRIQRLQRRSAAAWHKSNTRPLQIGASIAHPDVGAGSIGAFVKKNGKRYVLSNNHVLANENRAFIGDAALQRAQLDGGTLKADAVGKLAEWSTLNASMKSIPDAALAEIDASVEIDPSRLRGLRNGMDARLRGHTIAEVEAGGGRYGVSKLGRTSGATSGFISAFKVDNVAVGYEMGTVIFNDCIEIDSGVSAPFSRPGDSGSLIVNDDMDAVGLLFGGGVSPRSSGRDLTYAHPIHTTLSTFGVDLLT